MHIAICDDNIADRKHLERLLSRESDKRMGTPNLLYVDSYGDREHFLFHPLMYDMIFMDMSESPALTAEIVATITEMGFTAPIVLYSSKIDYTQLLTFHQMSSIRRSHIFLILCQSFWLWVMPMYRGILKRYPCILLMDANIIFQFGTLYIIHLEKMEMPSI